jgi:hypothetical protein
MQPTAGWSERSIEYQQRIGQMPPAAPGHLTEWMFNGVSFDGFDSQQCLLKEAKAGYDQFFDEWGVPKEFFRGMEVMQEQFRRQAAAAVPRPPTRLRWHFMEPKSYRHFALEVSETFPDVETVFLP